GLRARGRAPAGEGAPGCGGGTVTASLLLERDAPLVPAIPAGGGTLRVRISPLVGEGDELRADLMTTSEPRMDMQQVLTTLRAVATRAASQVRNGTVVTIKQPHRHPASAPCLRCAVTGASRSVTMSATMLEILHNAESTEEWNLSRKCNLNNTAARLRRLAISESTLEDIYGPYWSEVLIAAMRIENTDFSTTRKLIDSVGAASEMPIDIEAPNTRTRLAAYHLGTIALPRQYRNGNHISSLQRNQVLQAIGTALGAVATGRAPYWLDHLAAPIL
ncbi:MAG: hypothetical protein WAV90_18520, partial [Gordonia amarae]